MASLFFSCRNNKLPFGQHGIICCDKVTDDNETVIVTRKGEKNVVIISLDEWNALQKALRNAEYLGKLNRSATEVKTGRGIAKTMGELEALSNE